MKKLGIFRPMPEDEEEFLEKLEKERFWQATG
jgi:hypothetical protein